MRKRITRIAPFQMGKVFAVLYAIFSIPIAVIVVAKWTGGIEYVAEEVSDS